ncbi:hypothetical protein Dimus_014003 [Dionaea muscipula]
MLGRFSSSACCCSILAGRGGARPPSHELGLFASSMSLTSWPRAQTLSFVPELGLLAIRAYREGAPSWRKRRSSGEELSSTVDVLDEEPSSAFDPKFGEVSSLAHGLSSACCYCRHARLKWEFGLTLWSTIAQVWEKPKFGSCLCSSWAWGWKARLLCKAFMSSASMHGWPELSLDGCSDPHGCDWPS